MKWQLLPTKEILNGAKLRRLNELCLQGLPVPPTMAIVNFTDKKSLSNHDQIQFVRNVRSQLGSQLIVRSNMITEDSQRSEAGRYLSVRVDLDQGEDLWSAIEQVRNSGMMLGLQQSQIGFFIQSYLATGVGGVLFTQDPCAPFSKNWRMEISAAGPQKVTESGGDVHVFSPKKIPASLRNFQNFLKQVRRLQEKSEDILDIEFAQDPIDPFRYYFLQLRPVQSEEAAISKWVRQFSYSRALAAERFPRPMTPLGWDLLKNALPVNLRVLERYLRIHFRHPESVALKYKGWIYLNQDFFSRKNLQWQPEISWNYLRLILLTLSLGIAGLFPKKLKNSLRLLLLRKIFVPWIQSCHRDFEANLQSCHELRQNLENELLDPAPQSKTQILNQLQRIEQLCFRFFADDLWIYFLKTAVLNGLQSWWQHTPKQWMAFLNGLQTGWLNRNLQAFSDRTKLDRKTYLDTHGHLRTDWDLSRPSLAKDLDRSSAFVGNFASTSATEEKPNQDLSFLNSAEMALATELKKVMWMDEEMNYWAGKYLQLVDLLLSQYKSYLIENKILQHEDQIYFLQLNELKTERWPSTEILEQRMRQFQSAPADPRAQASSKIVGKNQLTASAGQAAGALFILEDYDFCDEIPDHSVVIAPHPHPSLIAHLPRIKALITEEGGLLSHTFIAAREFGIPAMIDPQIFRQAKSWQGQHVHFDADQGRLRLENG